MAEKYELAYADYKAGMKQKDIATKYDVTINTVKSWQQRKWKKLDEQGTDEKVCTPKKSMHTKKEGVAVEKEHSDTEDEGEELQLDEYGLTAKQRRFCEYYVRTLNATNSYKKAYKVKMSVAMSAGSRMLRNVKVKRCLADLKKERCGYEVEDVLASYKAIAFADITDFIDFSQVETTAEVTETEYDDSGKVVSERTTEEPYTYTKFAMHHSDEIDGTLLSEISRGKDGVFKIKMHDKMRAMEFLMKYRNALTADEINQLKYEHQKMKNIQMERELGGNQHKADPFDSMSIDDLEKHLAELGDAE